MRRQNLNTAERIQREKVGVASDDVCSVSTHRKFQELVVLCISASPYLDVDLHPFSLTRQSREKASNIFLLHIAAEPLSAQDFMEFGQRRERNQDSSFPQSNIKCVARFRIEQE